MPDARADQLIRRFEELRTGRSTFEADLQDIVDLVMPAQKDINRQTFDGSTRWQYKYDGTATQALLEFASGLCSYITNPSERWFELEFMDYDPAWDDEALAWLEDTSMAIYEVYRYPITAFTTAMHEGYLSLGSLGTTIINQEMEYRPFPHISLTSVPFAECYLSENSGGKVDTVYRKRQFTTRQLLEKFDRGSDYLDKELYDEKTPMEKRWEVLHCVYPRNKREPGAMATSMLFASVWVDLTHKSVIRESGYDDLPYHVARWIKYDNEPYGRSPAHTCLPEIRMVNSMERTNIRVGQKIADPPLMVPDDDFATPIKTSPGSLIYVRDKEHMIEPLLSGSQLPIAIEQTEQKRGDIRRAFHNDWLKLGKEKQEMTAYETADRRNEKLQMLAPMLGRIQSEWVGPMINRTYALLQSMGKIRPAPASIQGRSLRISYVGDAAKAQSGSRATNMARFIEDLVPMGNIKPNIFDAVDEEAFVKELAASRGVTRKILRNPAAIEQMRQQRQMQEAAAAAEPASKAIKNIADARQAVGA